MHCASEFLNYLPVSVDFKSCHLPLLYVYQSSKMIADGKPREVKVVLLGDTGVGKSSLVLRFVTNNFKQFSESTIGASFMSKVVTVDGKQTKFQIWDTAGQEKYHSLARKLNLVK